MSINRLDSNGIAQCGTISPTPSIWWVRSTRVLVAKVDIKIKQASCHSLGQPDQSGVVDFRGRDLGRHSCVWDWCQRRCLASCIAFGWRSAAIVHGVTNQSWLYVYPGETKFDRCVDIVFIRTWYLQVIPRHSMRLAYVHTLYHHVPPLWSAKFGRVAGILEHLSLS